jgi:hypothetical protein
LDFPHGFAGSFKRQLGGQKQAGGVGITQRRFQRLVESRPRRQPDEQTTVVSLAHSLL